MEPITYTNAAREDQGALNDATLDLEYGRDDNSQANTFELTMDRNADIRLEPKSLIYIEGTEYGGLIKGLGTDTDDDLVTYTGMTWHGLLNAHVLTPDSGQDYLVLQGDAHEVLLGLIGRMGLQDIFTAPVAPSGIQINHKTRHAYGYFVILDMLKASSAKLKMTYESGMVILSAAMINDYSRHNELDTMQISMDVSQDFMPVNHLVCLGKGELKDRIELHYYADAEGNVSTERTFSGIDENTLIYDYTNADEEELAEKGPEKLKELQNCDTIDVNLPEDQVLDIEDVVGGIDPITGIEVAANVSYKVVTIDSNGVPTVSYKVGDTSASKTMSGRSESSGGGVVYTAGRGIDITGRVISAEVAQADLDDINAAIDGTVNNVAATYPIKSLKEGRQVTVSIDLVSANEANSWFS